MNIAAIIHRPTLEYIYPKDRKSLCLRIQTSKNDIKDVTLVYWFRSETNTNNIKRIRLSKILSEKYCDYYEQDICVQELAAYVRYYFVLNDGVDTYSYGAKGFIKNEPEFNCNFFEFLWPNKTDGYYSICDANKLIYYQIFPERFKNGDDKITPSGALAWGSKPTRENFMGGDIKGIIDSLDYIESLGINCIYLTPIFMAPSNHKYDTCDYYKIDSSFGNEEEFRKLVDQAHSRNIKIILDGVFNHSGYYWPYFQDVVKKGKDSRYYDWFYINSYPVSLNDRNYDCVGHYKWMPKINTENPEVQNYFIKVGEYWISEFNIDGWRLDVADEINTGFLRRFVDNIKHLKPDVIILGETWGDAGKLIYSDHIDTAMNYLFRDAVVDWIAKDLIKPTQFDHLINRMLSLYPYEVSERMYNLLDSHDTPRFIYECNNDIPKYKLAIALQMTVTGCPAIFYGDEIGLSGDNDPDCRLCMQWDETKQNNEIRSWYTKLISIRKENEVLYKGGYRSLICDDDNNIYAFERKLNNEIMVIVINASDQDNCISLPYENIRWHDVLNEIYITESVISVPAFSVYILKKEENL